MNRLTLTGRLVRDPEVRTNGAGVSKCNFDLAVERIGAKEGLQDVDFIPCTVWNKQAENLGKYQGKGCLIGVEGEIRKDVYTDKDGNNKSYMYVLANRIEYLSGTGKKAEPKESEPVEDINEIVFTDEDLPF